MGDVISTAVENLNTIISSPDWSPPSAIYSNFNFSTWALPTFPAVPSGNQVAARYQKYKTLTVFLSPEHIPGSSSASVAVEYRVLVL